MKRIVLMLGLGICFSFDGLFAVYSDDQHSVEQIQQFHKSISNELLGISKKHTECKQSVYTALDMVSKVCNISKTAVNEKEKYNKLLYKEMEQTAALQNENDTLKKKVAALEKRASTSEKKLEAQLEDLNQVRKEKDDLSAKTQTIAEREKEYLSKVKMLEESLRQAPTQVAQADQNQAEQNSDAQTGDQSFIRTSTSAPSSPR